ncbi:MAG: hypothetical protein ACRDI2_04100 [Chloroflexota bacterium]
MANSVAVRVGRGAYESARRIAAWQEHSIAQVVEDALREYERRVFWERVASEMAALKADPERWAAYQAELRETEGTLLDGFDSSEDFRDLWNAQQRGEPIEWVWHEPREGTA